jgi:hypothetical protein
MAIRTAKLGKENGPALCGRIIRMETLIAYDVRLGLDSRSKSKAEHGESEAFDPTG